MESVRPAGREQMTKVEYDREKRSFDIVVPKGWDLIDYKITISRTTNESQSLKKEITDNHRRVNTYIRYRKSASLNIVGVGGIPIYGLFWNTDPGWSYEIIVNLSGEEYLVNRKGAVIIHKGVSPHRDAAVLIVETLLDFYVGQEQREDWDFFHEKTKENAYGN